ncbi:helix-turn-helix transcriptional regulator [Sphingomonas lycopersici]|uniref:HTH luxR-type domain-containing protein n=1 Tax=Sphingomonas lycopersici TaxID=2951807 RepID=A0AA41ZAX0_9SPHN|nr:hypothetical protein [Sphingomonas lycopersici]MCW6535977.1 hypothetical protein [Sphingomonas lycopersici]
MLDRARALERGTVMMTIVVALQWVAAIFFLVDVTDDVTHSGFGSYLIVEASAAVALFAGVVSGAYLVREMVLRARTDALAVATARGALAELMHLRFAEWLLTPAEAEVALFAIKGCDVGEIARLRGSAAGTIRAQLARIYAKAGVNSQTSLIALFIEELVEPIIHVDRAEAPNRSTISKIADR